LYDKTSDGPFDGLSASYLASIFVYSIKSCAQ